MSTKKDYPLSERWVLWYHSVANNEWNLESYQKLFVLSSVKCYYQMINTIPNISAGMFFLMRDGVSPLWEDPLNIAGGYWSCKVHKSNCNLVWKDLCAALIGNHLTKKSENMSLINGISFSPKISNCIFRIWNNNKRYNNKKLIINNIKHLKIDESLYKSYN